MTWAEQELLDAFWFGELHKLVDKAAKEYEFGMARSSEFLEKGQHFTAGAAPPFHMSTP